MAYFNNYLVPAEISAGGLLAMQSLEDQHEAEVERLTAQLREWRTRYEEANTEIVSGEKALCRLLPDGNVKDLLGLIGDVAAALATERQARQQAELDLELAISCERFAQSEVGALKQRAEAAEARAAQAEQEIRAQSYRLAGRAQGEGAARNVPARDGISAGRRTHRPLPAARGARTNDGDVSRRDDMVA